MIECNLSVAIDFSQRVISVFYAGVIERDILAAFAVAQFYRVYIHTAADVAVAVCRAVNVSSPLSIAGVVTNENFSGK